MNCAACGKTNVSPSHIFDCSSVKGLVSQAKEHTREKTPEELEKVKEVQVLRRKVMYYCPDCKEQFKNQSALVMHRTGVHDVKLTHAEYDARCNVCHKHGITYPTLEALNIHIEREHSNKPTPKSEDSEVTIPEIKEAMRWSGELLEYYHRHVKYKDDAWFILKPSAQKFIVEMSQNFRKFKLRTFVTRKQYNWLKQLKELITTHKTPL